MLRRFILTITLALLFGLGQQGAAIHQISHLDDLAPVSQHDKAAHSVCDQCLGYSGIAHALHSSSFALPLLQSDFALPVFQATSSLNLTSSPYSARAPPQFV